MYESRNFVIFNVSELNKIDFNQVLETSVDTIRKSIDGTMTFIKWEGDLVPNCILLLTTNTTYLTYNEMLVELNTPEWLSPIDPMSIN